MSKIDSGQSSGCPKTGGKRQCAGTQRELAARGHCWYGHCRMKAGGSWIPSQSAVTSPFLCPHADRGMDSVVCRKKCF